MEIVMYYFLNIDYALSSWFSKTRDKIIPGTAFLFLNKVVFLLMSFFLAATGLLKIDIRNKAYVVLVVLIAALIMYGLQSRLEKLVQNFDFEKTFSKCTQKEIIMKRILGIFYLALSFYMIFVVVLIMW